MEINVTVVFLVLILMISQKIHAVTYTTGYESPHGARHTTNETTIAISSTPAIDTQFPPATVAPDEVPGTVGVSPSSSGLLPVKD